MVKFAETYQLPRSVISHRIHGFQIWCSSGICPLRIAREACISLLMVDTQRARPAPFVAQT